MNDACDTKDAVCRGCVPWLCAMAVCEHHVTMCVDNNDVLGVASKNSECLQQHSCIYVPTDCDDKS